MEKYTLKKELPLLVLLALPFIYILTVWAQLPAQVPLHFDAEGNVNDWGNKFCIFIMPAIGAAIYGLLAGIPQIDPKKMSEEVFHGSFYRIRLVLGIFFCILALYLVHLSLPNVDTHSSGRLIPLLILGLLAALGNFMLNIKPNWFIGVRTPWTLSSEAVWKKTHLLFGRLWFFGGILCMGLVLLLPESAALTIILCFALGSTALSLAYSYWIYNHEQAGS